MDKALDMSSTLVFSAAQAGVPNSSTHKTSVCLRVCVGGNWGEIGEVDKPSARAARLPCSHIFLLRSPSTQAGKLSGAGL
jgi:hypothetical protein